MNFKNFRTTCNNAKIEIACLKNSLDNSQNLNKRLEVKTNNDFVKIECKYQKLEEKFEKTMEAKQVSRHLRFVFVLHNLERREFCFLGGGGSKNLDLGSEVKQRICLW